MTPELWALQRRFSLPLAMYIINAVTVVIALTPLFLCFAVLYCSRVRYLGCQQRVRAYLWRWARPVIKLRRWVVNTDSERQGIDLFGILNLI